MRRVFFGWLLVLTLAQWTSNAAAQNVNSATETTQVANFLQLMQMGFTAENQLQSMKTMIDQARFTMKRLSKGDVSAIRDAIYQAMTVQSMVGGFLASTQTVASRLQTDYPSPNSLDNRFQSWPQYYAHLRQVEESRHRSYTEAGQVVDKQLREGAQQDGRIVQKLREQAGQAESETQNLQVIAQILLELVRQMQMLRTEHLAAFKLQVLDSAAESQRRVAQDIASQELLQPVQMEDRSQYKGYGIAGSGVP